ncbi:MAG: hypothetical protein ACLGPL_12045, partial [Acidobacteriota bacterium]
MVNGTFRQLHGRKAGRKAARKITRARGVQGEGRLNFKKMELGTNSCKGMICYFHCQLLLTLMPIISQCDFLLNARKPCRSRFE